ncbi:hypothetical protein OF83DRAFT_1179291 [Amylostereum chailletii]|nr:hypothetical protein OF83DRAFT_1179291 [Amylostereum chailletii]
MSDLPLVVREWFDIAENDALFEMYDPEVMEWSLRQIHTTELVSQGQALLYRALDTHSIESMTHREHLAREWWSSRRTPSRKKRPFGQISDLLSPVQGSPTHPRIDNALSVQMDNIAPLPLLTFDAPSEPPPASMLVPRSSYVSLRLPSPPPSHSVNLVDDAHVNGTKRSNKSNADQKRAFPLKYACDMKEGFETYARLGKSVGKQEVRFTVAFPGAKFAKGTWNRNFTNGWEKASEELRKKFVDAGTSPQGQWDRFMKEVRDYC